MGLPAWAEEHWSAPACAAIINVATGSVSASASIITRPILVFMFILFVASSGAYLKICCANQ